MVEWQSENEKQNDRQNQHYTASNISIDILYYGMYMYAMQHETGIYLRRRRIELELDTYIIWHY